MCGRYPVCYIMDEISIETQFGPPSSYNAMMDRKNLFFLSKGLIDGGKMGHDKQQLDILVRQCCSHRIQVLVEEKFVSP